MKVDVLGLKIDDVGMEDAVAASFSFIDDPGCHCIFTPNAEMAMTAVKSPEFMAVLNSSDLLVPDGAGVVLGARILGTPLKSRVPGVDLVNNILSSGRALSVFLLGGAPGIAEKAADIIKQLHSNISVVGTMHGYHPASFEDELVGHINRVKPDLLLVALGVPAQEMWIHRNRHRLNARLCIGCGGTIDILSGAARRAPSFFIRMNLEWLHRLIRQPKRFFRMLRIPAFLFLCIKKRLFGKSIEAV
ncbi:MAG: WecB/TagA/CpsF family glycosyltransferase [Clostridia bacterium]